MFKSNFDKAFDRAVDAADAVLDHPFWNILDHPDFPFISIESVTNSGRNFPPYNIIDLGNDATRLDIAVAGYSKERLSVELEGSVLNIIGKAYQGSPEEIKTTGHSTSGSLNVGGTFRKQGISNASFLRSFSVQASCKIDSVSLADGILSIMISAKQPETKKLTFEIS
jgi:molecular chaperone IbpA